MLMIWTAGCTTQRTVKPPASGEPHTVLQGEVRVVHVDGRSYVLHDARIQSDSVIGTNAAGSRIAIATSEVGTINERRFSPARTAGLVGGTAVAIMAVAFVVAAVMFASIY